MKEETGHRDKSWRVEEFAQRSCVVSVLGCSQDPAGKNTELPGLTSPPDLSQGLY